MAIIFHITSEAEWQSALNKGYYETPSLKDEGFIHCCRQTQVEGVLMRYFAGKENLVRLEIETDHLKSPFYYDWSPSVEDTFPHVYGVINAEAIKNVQRIR